MVDPVLSSGSDSGETWLDAEIAELGKSIKEIADLHIKTAFEGGGDRGGSQTKITTGVCTERVAAH